MKKVKLFIATSLDGYIADKNNRVDFLDVANNKEYINPYNEFIKGIDIVVMGYNTYDQIVNELSTSDWIYKDLKAYVLTHKKIKSNFDNIVFINEDLNRLITKLKNESNKDIWICGGANLINQLINLDLIDEYHLTIVPIILGDGIKLFAKTQKSINLKLLSSKSSGQITDLIFERIKKQAN